LTATPVNFMSATSFCDNEFSTVTQLANVSISATAPSRARFKTFPKFAPHPNMFFSRFFQDNG
jgi:hypothetical protein